jgi:hypothetical protein
MAATRDEQLQNLARLRGDLAPHCTEDASAAHKARDASSRMPLTHSTNEATFVGILSAGALLSNDARGQPSRAVDQKLGTTNDVFLYLGAAAFPHKEMAFIFKAALTDHSRGRAVATPFDSGGCDSRFPLPAGTNAVDFVRRHEMPAPECRDYLGDLLARYFESVDSYLSGQPYFACAGCRRPLPDPHGLAPAAVDDCGLDRLHEVRIAERVELALHLDAVLVPNGMAPPNLAKFRKAGVKIHQYPRALRPAPGQTHALRKAATAFIMRHYLS